MVETKALKEKPKKKTWKDPNKHNIEFLVAGDYEYVWLSCELCGLMYKLTKKEVDSLG